MDSTHKSSSSSTVVQLDGLALLKILVHCRDSSPELVSGQLVGLDVDGVVEVTNCFPMPSDEDGVQTQTSLEEYQVDMLKALRSVNVDHNAVGWYYSSYFTNALSTDFIDHHYHFQKDIPNAIVLLHDPFQTTKGRLFLRAYRLSQSFMKSYGENRSVSDVDSSSMLEELSIKVHNSHLIHGFLYELRENSMMSCEPARLSLDVQGSLERSLNSLSNCLDDLQVESGRIQYYQRQVYRQKQSIAAHLQRRQMENEARLNAGKEPLPEEDTSKNPLFKPIPKPARLESHIVSKQIQEHVAQIKQNSEQAMQRLYLATALHDSNANEQ